jgi:serine/threonine protein kinase
MSEPLDVNTTLSHYRIVSKIGAGGMGEVYLAQGTKLDRKHNRFKPSQSCPFHALVAPCSERLLAHRLGAR